MSNSSSEEELLLLFAVAKRKRKSWISITPLMWIWVSILMSIICVLWALKSNNLCSLPFPRYLENNSGGLQNYLPPSPPKKDIGVDLGADNLCSLCFGVPEFSLPPFLRCSENNSGRLLNYLPPPPPKKKDEGLILVPIICALCVLKSQNSRSLPLPAIRKTTLAWGLQKYLPSSKKGYRGQSWCP